MIIVRNLAYSRKSPEPDMSSIVFFVLPHTPAILTTVQKEASARAGEARLTDKLRGQCSPLLPCSQTSTPMLYISRVILSDFYRNVIGHHLDR